MKKRDAESKDDIAKEFWSGRSQAIRLPREYRFSCREVTIHREGNRVVLEPSAEPATDALGWPLSFWELFGALDESFDVGERNRPHERQDPLK